MVSAYRSTRHYLIRPISLYLAITTFLLSACYRENTLDIPMNHEEDPGLAKQLDASRRMWPILVTQGFKPGSEATMNVYFYSDNEASASKLFSLLREEKSYSVRLNHDPEYDKPWGVAGETTPIVLTEDSMLEFVKEMHSLGREYDSEFDGFEVKVSDAN